MKKTKRGQAALEFLMTYGWAILVVLVAIGALAYFGVLSPERLVPEKCVVASGSGLFCDDYAADSGTNNLTLRIKNILADSVTVSSTEVENCGTLTQDIIIQADEVADIGVICSTTALVAGEKMNGDITITYSKGTSGLTKYATGQIVTTAA